MNIWTTFTPRKLSWELTKIASKGHSASSDWQKNIKLIDSSLEKLKESGISGLRLVIFPSEITNDGKLFNWEPIEQMLELCKKHQLEVDLCIGPFQYPHYPGIYLPERLLRFRQLADPRNDKELYIDDDPEFYNFGLEFIKEQLLKFGNDKRIHGFHFANEWPDMQRVEGHRDARFGVSEKFMLDGARVLKQMTKKPIALNTNIDISDKNKITKTFGDLLKILSGQAELGFDIYPSQNKWKKVPIQKLRSLILDYSQSFKSIQNQFPECEMYFAEVEAQPWGSGQSWYQLITEEPHPNSKVLEYYNNSLETTFKEYIEGTGCKTVSLWGSDFWLTAFAMGISWPLASIKTQIKN